MKKVMFLILAAVLAVISLSGCVVVSIGSETVKGEGEKVLHDYDVSAFSEVIINGNFEVIYTSAPQNRLELEIHENLLKYVEIGIKGEKLTIYAAKNFTTNSSESPIIYLSAPTLKSIEIDGVVNFHKFDTVRGSDLSIAIDGVCMGSIPVEVEYLKLDVSGVADVSVSGTADEAVIGISGTGKFSALELQARMAMVNIDGMGEGSLSCSEKLTVNISGMGSFTYRGEPEVISNADGLGTVKQIR